MKLESHGLHIGTENAYPYKLLPTKAHETESNTTERLRRETPRYLRLTESVNDRKVIGNETLIYNVKKENIGDEWTCRPRDQRVSRSRFSCRCRVSLDYIYEAKYYRY